MGSGNNLTPVASGLLRRRYSVPEIIMRKHSLAQQKTYDESVAVTAPSPYRSPGPVYYKSYSTNTPNRTYPISSGSDSNLSRRPERGEMSMRKSTLLRRIWSRELKRYDTRSGSCSPPMRRSQRRLHAEPIESSRCEECRKLDDDDPSDESEEAASRKRLRLISNGKEPSDESCVSNYSRSVVSERVPMTTSSSLESSPLTNGRTRNVHIYMTPMKSDRSISEPSDQGQDMLHVEIDLDNSEENGNIRDASDQSTDENENKAEIESSLNTTTEINENTNGKRDSPLDRFISKLLIDNLADLADEINEQFENNNNLVQNESDLKEKRVSSVYFSPEHMEAVVNRLHTSEVSSTNGTSSHDIPDPNMNKSDEAGHERIIYFPSCSLECKDDMSSYTSNCSDFELNSIPNTEVVKVSTGSTYPIGEQKEALVIPRMLGTFPRTESLEAQHSMASALDDENGNESDDSVSLVDSLDDPTNSALNEEIVSEQHEPKNGIETQEEDTASVCREKPEAFFVPIAGSELKEVQSVPVARSMPEKLKEKILQRQRELDTKRGEELKKKQKKIEKIMDPKLEEENFYEKSPVRCKKDSPVKEKPPVSKNGPKKSRTKGNAVLLRTEIGLLESYTIDSKGNMQFKPPQKTDSSLSCNTTTSTTTTTTTTTKKTSRTPITRKRSILPSKAPESAGQSFEKKSITSQTKSKKSVIKDVQKMTIFQAQSDIITPDLENGPRRVYQKTEIQDGEKRIEILEIVECIETSPETSPDRHQYTYRCGATKSALARHSKIPIPIYKLGRSAGYQKSTRCPLRESSPTTAKCLSRNLQGSASNKVDRVIAELLIDALNRPEEMGIEIVKSPKDMSRDKSQRRQNAQRRNTPRRSANSGKYQQVFEVIPEEKSSFSVDSSTDEPSRLSKIHLKSAGSNSKSSTNQIVTTATTKEVQSSSGATVATTSNNCLTSSSSSSQKTSTNSGRVAVDRAEPKAWIGFFKRHNDSSMDEGRLMHCL